jgi:acetyl-CoA acyltransferase 2
MLWRGLTDPNIDTPMAITAAGLAGKYNITRKETDEYALRSQKRWRLANNNGHFKQEIEPMKIKSRKGEILFEVDEHPSETTLESLAKLPPAFTKSGVITSGSASVSLFPELPKQFYRAYVTALLRLLLRVMRRFER